jgi:catechol 2,3-dioxygenase-like lactoylglutathione lyase family enzyme
MARVTGLGGIFYKVTDPDRTKRWYEETLGLGGEYGIHFAWQSQAGDDPYSLISAFSEATDYFGPSEARFMINLRVDDLDALVADLEARGIEILGKQEEPYGKFAWILDCDGIKLELFQQIGPAPA